MPAQPVDTHIERVSKRLGITNGESTATGIQNVLEHCLPPDGQTMYAFHVDMVRHGREICQARAPRCAMCVLTDVCAYYARTRRQRLEPDMSRRSTTRLVIVRHGQTAANTAGSCMDGPILPLDETGERQATAGGAPHRRRDRSTTPCYPARWPVLERPLARFPTCTGLEIEERAELREMHFGDLEGVTGRAACRSNIRRSPHKRSIRTI